MLPCGLLAALQAQLLLSLQSTPWYLRGGIHPNSINISTASGLQLTPWYLRQGGQRLRFTPWYLRWGGSGAEVHTLAHEAVSECVSPAPTLQTPNPNPHLIMRQSMLKPACSSTWALPTSLKYRACQRSAWHASTRPSARRVPRPTLQYSGTAAQQYSGGAPGCWRWVAGSCACRLVS